MRPTRIRDLKMLQYRNFNNVMETEPLLKNGISLSELGTNVKFSEIKNRIFFTILKRKNLLFVLLLICNSIYAQVKVTSNGNLVIGNTTASGANINVLTTDRSAYRITERYPFSYGSVTPVQVDNSTTAVNEVILNVHGVGQYTNFYVRGSGDVWAKGQWINGSDISFKEDIREIESPLDKILKLRGITYQNKLKPKTPFVFKEDVAKDGDLGMWDAASKRPTPEVEKQIYAEIEMPRIGFIAQEVEEVIPEVVKTQLDGTKGIAYMELIAVLVEAIKEQQSQIQELQVEVGVLKSAVLPNSSLRSSTNEAETTEITNVVVDQCKLYQNAPNPFNQSTEIKYYLPQDVKTAFLCIYNLQGTQIKQIPIMLRGEGSQLISGSELNAGMYLYALIVDGKEVDTKRMILTK